jgi:hypothetical protein
MLVERKIVAPLDGNKWRRDVCIAAGTGSDRTMSNAMYIQRADQADPAA